MRFFFLLSNEKGITLTIDKIYIMKHLINYGKHVDLHNNGKLVYVDLHKTGNKQLEIGQHVLERIQDIEPIQNFDRNKSYPHRVSLITEIMYGEWLTKDDFPELN